ncbi:MAG: hypothetical protein JST30_05470, partial [Armatimonadetes bacterium]|nr:hypothetical protein [Armatimonadota bacterium]
MFKRALALGLLSLVAHAAMAAYSAEAFNNATIQIAGPRQGTNGKNFFNIEGEGNAENFRSWGAADFHGTDFNIGMPVNDVTDFKIVLTEANAAFTLPGTVKFWISTDTVNSIDPGTSPFVWQNDVTPDGAGNQLPTVFLGSGQFNTTGNANSGQVDAFPCTLSDQAKSILIDALNNGKDIRIVVTPDSTDPDFLNVAATFAGFSHNTYQGPTLEFEASMGSTTEILAPVNGAVSIGKSSSGGFGDTAVADGVSWRVCKFVVTSATSPIVRVRFDYTTTKTAPTAIDWAVTAKMVHSGTFKVQLLLSHDPNNPNNNAGYDVILPQTAINTT